MTHLSSNSLSKDTPPHDDAPRSDPSSTGSDVLGEEPRFGEEATTRERDVSGRRRSRQASPKVKKSHPLAQFEGAFSAEERGQLRAALLRADRKARLPALLPGQVAAWNVVNLPVSGKLFCATRLKSDLVFTGRTVEDLAATVEAWADGIDARACG
jgi:hypothetical protein